jgi:hypothetical protein
LESSIADFSLFLIDRLNTGRLTGFLSLPPIIYLRSQSAHPLSPYKQQQKPEAEDMMATSTSAYANAAIQREAARTKVAVVGAGFLGKYVPVYT